MILLDFIEKKEKIFGFLFVDFVMKFICFVDGCVLRRPALSRRDPESWSGIATQESTSCH